MVRPSLSTRIGDTGETRLLGGKRVSKASVRLHAYGTVDELNACIGLVLTEEALPEDVREHLVEVQRLLFVMGADLASADTSKYQITADDVEELEAWGANLEQALPALQKFILPSGSRAGALFHQARTVCRRAERWTVGLSEKEPVNPQVLIYLNRLSDYLFLEARAVNKAADEKEVEWES